MSSELRHYGDPCVHCGLAHDGVPPGPCNGDPEKAVPVAYAVVRQAWQHIGGADTIRLAMSDGTIREECRHPGEWWWTAPWYRNARTLAPHEFHQLYETRP
jgi:hypothetical protein